MAGHGQQEGHRSHGHVNPLAEAEDDQHAAADGKILPEPAQEDLAEEDERQ